MEGVFGVLVLAGAHAVLLSTSVGDALYGGERLLVQLVVLDYVMPNLSSMNITSSTV